jgi:hypothetical protein
VVLRGLFPVVRYSAGRQAYVLRGVGRRFGPVFVSREESVQRERVG